MENKAPIKKVLLRKEDEFYIYDKRINKCAKDGCDGTVKYGLNLQIQMSNGDTLNSYECNKCHMKYVAYPNYVRLKDGKHIHIYNYSDVRLKDNKRRDEARKKANKLEKNQHKKPFGEKFQHKADLKKPFEKKPFEKKRFKDDKFDKRYSPRRYSNVTTIGGYQKSYQAVFGESVAADD